MPTLEARPASNTDAIFEAVTHLNEEDFKSFLLRMLLLNAQKKTPLLADSEANLLGLIRRKPTPAFKGEYRALKRKRDDETLTPNEQERLIELSDELEQHNALRYAALGALAKIRGVSWDELKEKLHLKPLLP